jgi:hypothetical protein
LEFPTFKLILNLSSPEAFVVLIISASLTAETTEAPISNVSLMIIADFCPK